MGINKKEIIEDCYLYIFSHMTRTIKEYRISVEIGAGWRSGNIRMVYDDQSIPKGGLGYNVSNKEGEVYRGFRVWLRKKDPVRAAKIFIENEQRIIKEHQEAIERAISTIDALNEMIIKEEMCDNIARPPKIDIFNDSPEEATRKWEKVKQFYKDHPEIEQQWKEWINQFI